MKKTSGPEFESEYSYHIKIFNVGNEEERKKYEFLIGEAYEDEDVEVLYTERNLTTKEFLLEYRRKKEVPDEKKKGVK